MIIVKDVNSMLESHDTAMSGQGITLNFCSDDMKTVWSSRISPALHRTAVKLAKKEKKKSFDYITLPPGSNDTVLLDHLIKPILSVYVP